ncbi:MAG: hypothetical protein M1830_006214 [Pleopsidium flavum]|nr:MAG: hypothetical protein M1830_006214 [Pleopsidium flavum]
MPSLVDIVTVLSSTALRLFTYVFLRWIPGHVLPPLIYTAAAIYVVSFIINSNKTSPYEVVADEVDITIREEDATQPNGKPPALPSSAAHSQTLASTKALQRKVDEPELDIEETILLGKKDPQVLWTLLTGLPSPTSMLWSLVVIGLNLLLVLFAVDLVYGRLKYPSNDVSFARVGYVSDSTANILIREPNTTQLPVYVSYRRAEVFRHSDQEQYPLEGSWKSAGQIFWLSNETDYTYPVTISRLRPSSRYQYAVSNNHTGYFNTAPPVGHLPARADYKFTFLTSSCIKPNFPYNPFSHSLSIPGLHHITERIPDLKASFMLFLGDFIYVDVPKRLGTDAETYRREYRQVYASPDWPPASAELPWIHVLDDHEIANDWDKNTTGVYHAAVDPWHHYQTSVNPPPTRAGESHFQFTQGPASFFMMDTRRHRSPEFDAPVNATEKTMLGQQQLTDVLFFLRRTEPHGVKWKIIISSIPFTKNWRFNNADTWAGYLHERQVVLEAMWDVGLRGGVGVVVLSGDRHEFAATAFPPPRESKWPLSATVHEFSTSPLSMFYLPVRTYWQEDEEDVCIKYLPDGNSKFGAVEITNPEASDQSVLKFRLFIDGKEAWSYVITTPPNLAGGGRGKDALWG